MLASDIDAVVICTPDDAHHAQVLAAAAAGKHLFCEKPVAMDLAQASEMVAACERANVRTMTGFLLPYAPIAQELVRRVRDGEFGELISIHTQRYNPRLLGAALTAQWRYDAARSSAGVLSDLGSHMLNFSVLIGGPITHIAASLRTVIKEVPDPATGGAMPLTLDDDVVLALRFASGVHGTIATSRVGHVDSDKPLGRSMIQINGTKAAVVTDGLEHAEVYRYGHPTEAIEPDLGPRRRRARRAAGSNGPARVQRVCRGDPLRPRLSSDYPRRLAGPGARRDGGPGRQVRPLGRGTRGALSAVTDGPPGTALPCS